MEILLIFGRLMGVPPLASPVKYGGDFVELDSLAK